VLEFPSAVVHTPSLFCIYWRNKFKCIFCFLWYSFLSSFQKYNVHNSLTFLVFV